MSLQINDINLPPVENEKIKSKIAFMQFMGRKYSCLDEDPISHLVLGFFHRIKKGKSTEKFDNKIKELLHPLNQQGLFKKGVEIAQNMSRNKVAENLQQKLKELEVENHLTSNDETPIFNPAYTSNPSLIRTAMAISAFVILGSIIYFVANKFGDLSGQLQRSTNDIETLGKNYETLQKERKQCDELLKERVEAFEQSLQHNQKSDQMIKHLDQQVKSITHFHKTQTEALNTLTKDHNTLTIAHNALTKDHNTLTENYNIALKAIKDHKNHEQLKDYLGIKYE